MTATGAAVWDWDAAARRAGVGSDGMFNAGAMALPAGRSVIWRRADGSSRSFSGAQLQQRAREVAAALSWLGVRRGDRVAGLLGRRPASFAAALGTWHLGAVYVPLFSGFGSDGLLVRLADCGPVAVVTDAANRPALDPAAATLPGMKILLVEETDRPGDLTLGEMVARNPVIPEPARTSLHETSTIMYTSGTTGKPKGCLIPHRGVITLQPYVKHFLALGAGDILFSGADAGWSFGLYSTGLAPMSAGAIRIIYEGAFDARGWWQAVADESASHVAAAPTAFRQLAAAGADLVPGRFRAGSSAGEPLDRATIDWFQRVAGVTLHDSYGLSELGMVMGNLRIPAGQEAQPGSLGQALPGFEIGLAGAGGELIAGDGTGRIIVRDNGFLLSAGYWGRQDEWDARFADGWFRTEDIARRDEWGRYWYQGRADDVIVSSGYNIGPAEVEAALLTHELVCDAACVAEPDPARGSIVSAHVVLTADPPSDLLNQLRQCVGASVGWHAAPRRVRVCERLPRTESGKVQRNSLREQWGSAAVESR